MLNFGDNVDRDTVDKVEQAGNSQQTHNRIKSVGDKSATKLSRLRRRFWRLSTSV